MDHIDRTFGIFFFFLNQSAMQYLWAHELITVDVAACTKLVQEQTSQNSGLNEGGDSEKLRSYWKFMAVKGQLLFFQEMATGR